MTNPAYPGRAAITARLEHSGVVAVLRTDTPDELPDVCRALRDGGVEACEITMTTPGALDAIAKSSQKLGKDAVIGVGSILDPETARAGILAGAQYVVGPTLNLAVIEMAHRYGKPAIPGGLTPTEILAAFQAGADVVKVFPADHFGPTYFKDLLAPLPQLRLMPTGGLNLETAGSWIKAGAVCIGLGTPLVKKELVKAKDWAGLAKMARQFVEIVKEARGA